MDLKLTGKTAIVTGSTAGIGLAIARRLAQEGVAVTITGRTQAKLDAAAADIGLPVNAVLADPATAEGAAALIAAVPATDILVNNLGIYEAKDFADITDEDWHRGMDVYFLNVVRPTRLVTPIMEAQGGGAIVNISTAWAFEPSEMFPTSAVARSGLAAFTKLFADEYAARNVRMNNVLPGWIDSLPATEQRRDMVPMQRYGTADEIAATVAFLASDGAGYITGQNLRVDGGLTRSV